MEALKPIGKCQSWVAYTQEGDERRAFCLKCRSWRCVRCGPAKRNRMTHLANEAAPTAFLTLTVDPKAFESPLAASRAMGEAWGKLMKRAKRHRGDVPQEYLMVWERTKAGNPHIHALLRGPFINQAWWSEQWDELVQSPIVYIEGVSRDRRAARYVTKYLLKDPDPFARGHAYRVSRNFFPEPMRPKYERPPDAPKWELFKGNSWQWLLQELQELRLVSVTESGEMRSAPWSAFAGHDNVLWLRWIWQTKALQFELKPPDPPPRAAGRPSWPKSLPVPRPVREASEQLVLV